MHVVTMGCAKNVVDSEKLMAQLRGNDVELAGSLDDADVAIINTCGFIDAAKEESVEMLMEHVRLKGRGRLRRVYAMGCLTERYRSELEKGIPELDMIFGTRQIADIVRELGGELRTELLGDRLLTTPSHSAYLKISEGCDHPCAFCAIPLMRGKHASRPIEEVLAEATSLARQGVKELVVIAQDTTFYGMDLDGKRQLPRLVERLADIDGVGWIRLMYAYPSHFPMELLDVMARTPSVCRYLDMPVQHIADPVLKSMRRGMTRRAIEDLVKRVRDTVPGIALRTTLIAGYPDEGEREFDELVEFVDRTRFERLGVFAYSREEDTTAYPLGDPVPAAEKERRRGVLMEHQREISEERNDGLVGSRMRVLVDRVEDGSLICRSEEDAPEIDNEVIVPVVPGVAPGDMSEVEILEAYEYDLYGRVLP